FYPDVMARPSFEKTAAIANEVMEEFLKENLDHVYFIYNEFKSALTQKVVVETLLPARPAKEGSLTQGSMTQGSSNFQKVDYLYEPSRTEVLGALLPKHVRVQVYRILLEAISSEHGARMTSMDSATSNAGEMISKLTLQANRVRQAAITTELMEIVSGAEALRG
ncbi:MAG: F0F1 ATP synthase subunit gamma, partial [Deltaproteobacteria bacterium]|nr:F0F1 ATP synthase subunit gamma [Deltaproteobacteria bacterium]